MPSIFHVHVSVISHAQRTACPAHACMHLAAFNSYSPHRSPFLLHPHPYLVERTTSTATMCGRFAQALPPRDYWDTVENELNARREERRRPATKDAGNKKDAGGSASSNNDQQDDQQKPMDNVTISMQPHDGEQEPKYFPTYNVAPGVQVPVVRMEEPVAMKGYGEGPDGSTTKALIVQSMRWGLLPHHTAFIPRGPDAMRTINARDDVVLNGQSMWTPLLRKGKRCIVFCQGFYEWQKKDNGATRIAHFVGMTNEGRGRIDVEGKERALMPMAGLWERCTIDEQEVLSFTVITTESNKQLNFLHDRMPVILPDKRSMLVWLGMQSASNEEICRLLKPYDQGLLDCYPVPKEVGRVGENDKMFILPVSSRKDGIAAAFGRMANKKQEEKGKHVQTESNAPIEEEVKSLDREKEKKRKSVMEKQEHDDERLAKRLQQEEEREAEKARKLQERQNRRATASEQEIEQKESETPSQSVDTTEAPSSRFSPDPYNPPVSPVRPNGGYSTVEYPDPAPYKRSSDSTGKSPSRSGGGNYASGAANPMKKRQLQESAKGTKDIRGFFTK